MILEDYSLDISRITTHIWANKKGLFQFKQWPLWVKPLAVKSRRCLDVIFLKITNGTNRTSSALRLLIPQWKPVSTIGNFIKLAHGFSLNTWF